ncbi:MAG: DNA polymerase III subunit gamma/tau [Candidatus Rokubacteria bacterium]|nr:DNA polymerase III subunit gamma/tau [Candidatus Rokubacteria bacterium]
MTYQVLARKWRPQSFDAVVGQDAVTRTLRNALLGGRVAHAYLCTGPRGVGKTTTARLLAKALGCTARTGPEACGACPACQDFVAGAPVDVLEIDAASNTGIDDIRTLRENVKFAPARGRFKIYIIDEIHMLSASAFNAFLKTLEEPPAHVVFIMATTDPKRIPATVLSRCQRFDFKPIPPPLLTEHLTEILTREEVPFEPAALPLLVRAAEGSLRDALSLLDAAIAYGEGRLEAASVASLLGSSSPAQVRAFLGALLSRDGPAALEAIDRVARQGEDLEGFCRDATEAARRLLVLTVAPAASLAECGPGEAEELAAAAPGVSVDELLYLLRALLEGQTEMRRSPLPRVELEIAAVRATRRPQPQAIEALIARVEEAERRLRAGAAAAGGSRPPVVQESLLDRPATSPPPGWRAPAPAGPPVSGGSGRAASAAPRAEPPVESASATEDRTAAAPPASDGAEALAEGWQRVVGAILGRKALLGAILQHASPVAVRDGALRVSMAANPFHDQQLADPSNRELINQAVHQHVPGARRIEVAQEDAPGSGAVKHPAVQAVLTAFGGEVVAVRPRAAEARIPEEGESQ